MKKTINESIEFLKTIDFKNISQEDLETILPTLGMNDECTHQMPGILLDYFGWGLKFWQYPNQLSKLIKFISTLNIDSYTEIGCRWGGTFVIINEVLKQQNPYLKSWACDLIDKSEVLNEYSNYSPFTYIKNNSHSEDFASIFPKNIDFIFIDGDHSYEGVKEDYEMMLKFNPRYMMFHDILCPDMGVYQFWNEIKTQYKHYEFTDQYDITNNKGLLGIGVIELN
jgi:hypothetical protein